MGLNWGVAGTGFLGGLGQGMQQGQNFMSNLQNYQYNQQYNPLALEHQRLTNQRLAQGIAHGGQDYETQKLIWQILGGMGMPPQGGGTPAPVGAAPQEPQFNPALGYPQPTMPQSVIPTVDSPGSGFTAVDANNAYRDRLKMLSLTARGPGGGTPDYSRMFDRWGG